MITAADVRLAASRIADGIVRTPTVASQTLSAMAGATVVLKLENLQFTASFKERGARNRLLTLDAESRERGVVAMSAGNHAQALAYHASLLGIPATVVMPALTPSVKVSRTRIHGAEVILHGEDLASAAAEAGRLEHERGLTFVHPYDDDLVIAGQGTVALEMLDDHPAIDTLVVPVGGGGLVAGVAVIAHALSPSIEVIGVQSARYPAMAAALGYAHGVGGGATIAEGIAVGAPGALTLPVARAHVADFLLVEEAEIEAAVGILVDVEKTIVEGAGAAALAAVLANGDRFAGRTVGVILSGGNIDPRLLASVLLRGLVRAGQLVTLHVETDDRPGSLARIASIVAAEGANIVDVRHSRLLTQMSIRSAQVEMVIEVTDPDQAASAIGKLRDAGFTTARVDPGD
ncbi:MAG: threonine ammonia-lyase [Acidimicrobiales bacterium]